MNKALLLGLTVLFVAAEVNSWEIIEDCSSLSCISVKPENCESGTVHDHCNCLVCAKILGEECYGPGQCIDGLKCSSISRKCELAGEQIVIGRSK